LASNPAVVVAGADGVDLVAAVCGGGGGVTALLQDEASAPNLTWWMSKSPSSRKSPKIREDVQASFQGIDFGSFPDLVGR
jgi:hypothetical protein